MRAAATASASCNPPHGQGGSTSVPMGNRMEAPAIRPTVRAAAPARPSGRNVRVLQSAPRSGRQHLPSPSQSRSTPCNPPHGQGGSTRVRDRDRAAGLQSAPRSGRQHLPRPPPQSRSNCNPPHGQGGSTRALRSLRADHTAIRPTVRAAAPALYEVSGQITLQSAPRSGRQHPIPIYTIERTQKSPTYTARKS